MHHWRYHNVCKKPACYQSPYDLATFTSLNKSLMQLFSLISGPNNTCLCCRLFFALFDRAQNTLIVYSVLRSLQMETFWFLNSFLVHERKRKDYVRSCFAPLMFAGLHNHYARGYLR